MVGKKEKRKEKKQQLPQGNKIQETHAATSLRPLLARDRWLEVKGRIIKGVLETNANGEILAFGNLCRLVPSDPR